MTREQMLAAVEQLFDADGSEDELQGIRLALKSALPHSNISDLIYYSDPELSPEQAVEEALRRERAHAAKEAAG